MATFFISDLHFGHKNIISYDRRPFDTVEDMDNCIINNWNEVVGKDDDVYILGDISWYKPTKTVEIINQLKGNKHLIIGNHDHKLIRNEQLRKCFVEICDYKELNIDGEFLVLSHYPILFFNHRHNGAIHLYGHVHNSEEWYVTKDCVDSLKNRSGQLCRMYNVGVMMKYIDYTPKTLDEILDYNETNRR